MPDAPPSGTTGTRGPSAWTGPVSPRLTMQTPSLEWTLTASAISFLSGSQQHRLAAGDVACRPADSGAVAVRACQVVSTDRAASTAQLP